VTVQVTVRVTVQTSERPPDRDDRQTTSRTDIPSSARIYDGDYFLGGKDNYPADRDAADQITAYLLNTRKSRPYQPRLRAPGGSLPGERDG
jgi:hypothetical protein